MGPPNSFDELAAPTRPETPNYNSDLEQLFNTDQNSDVYGMRFCFPLAGLIQASYLICKLIAILQITLLRAFAD